ncbi:MAG: hypothetical protein WBL77_24270, partial [Pseudolabrys sp.]
GYPMGQLIGVIAIIYIFVRLPRAGVRSNDGEFASADLHPRHSRPARVRSYGALRNHRPR